MRLALLLVVAGSVVMADEMSPVQIKTAIETGQAQKEVKLYRVSTGLGGRIACWLSTPTTRIQLAARVAKKNFKPFTEADVTPEMSATTVEVLCPSVPVGGSRFNHDIANVTNVVLTAKGGADPMQPASTKPLPESYQNSFGAHWEGQGMIATFPLEALASRQVLHVVYDHTVHVGFSKNDSFGLEVDPAKLMDR